MRKGSSRCNFWVGSGGRRRYHHSQLWSSWQNRPRRLGERFQIWSPLWKDGKRMGGNQTRNSRWREHPPAQANKNNDWWSSRWGGKSRLDED